MQQKTVLAMSVVISLLSGFAVAQDQGQLITSAKAVPSFTLHTLNESYTSLGLSYNLENAWPILKNVYKHTTVAEVTDRDIVRYDWLKQQIALTTAASQALKTELGVEVNDRLFAYFGTPHRAFVVAVDGEAKYGGVFLERYSAMNVRYPVIYLDEDKNGVIRMEVRPVHSINELDSSDPLWEIVRQDCIHDIFVRAGKLTP